MHTQRDKCKETDNVIKPDCAILTFKQCGLKINKRFRWTKEAVILIYNDRVRENPMRGGGGFVYCKPWWQQYIVELKRVEQRKTSSDFPPHCFSGFVGNEAITAAVKREAAKWKVKEGILLLIRSHITCSPLLCNSASLSHHAHMQTHTHAHAHTHTKTCWFLWFTGTFHRRNGFYTIQAECAIALHLP